MKGTEFQIFWDMFILFILWITRRKDVGIFDHFYSIYLGNIYLLIIIFIVFWDIFIYLLY